MEGLKSELRSLRQQVFQQSDGDCTPDLCSSPGIMQDMLESKKALWQEYKCIRREIEQLKHKLDRQEEDLFNQVSATHEIKRTQRQYCRMLEDLMNSHKAQTQDLDKARNETQSTQQELGHIKSTVTVLKEQVESLHLEDKLHAMSLKEESSHLNDKIFIPDLELEQSTPGGATGNRLEGAELNSELSTSLPELNLSDLISLT
ncbi:coiled-coil domain-containing protein 159-like isoform X2 [Tiliqua scincoides]|uniref:coiled-coil domain-containing protein 159-like isoform X2 n=1 Tax=Tiliqua scincoides TaxID=71010 RepID=UPI003462D26F